MDEMNCASYQNSLDDNILTLREKGNEGINRASAERNDTIHTTPGQKVHQTCRRSYCHPSNIAKAKRQENTTSQTSRSLRSLDRKTGQSISFKTDCFYCGTNITEEEKKRLGDVFRLTTLERKDTVLQTCSERGDAWAEEVQARISQVYDLPAADAMYHQACSMNFRTKKQIPKRFASDEPDHKRGTVGRPPNEDVNDSFLKGATSRYFESFLAMSHIALKMKDTSK